MATITKVYDALQPRKSRGGRPEAAGIPSADISLLRTNT
jgi:hypothetical protein